MRTIVVAALAAGSALSMPQDRDPISLFTAEWRRMPVGAGTLDDLAHPTAFLARAADRRIREQVRAQLHAIQPTGDFEPFAGLPRVVDEPGTDGPPIVDVPIDGAAAAFVRALPDGTMPSRRGFMPPVAWLAAAPFDSPELDPDDDLARIVAARLARDGLPATTVRAIAHLARHDPAALDDRRTLRDRLDRAGLPTDLLGCFTWADAPVTGADDALQHLLEATHGPTDAALRTARNARFSWSRTVPDFEPFPDDGSAAPGVLRAQVTRGNDWAGPGDGGSLDVVRQLVDAATAPRIVVSIESDFAPSLAHHVAAWAPNDVSVTIVAQSLPLSQWAQDSARLGRRRGSSNDAVALVPRWASRDEATSQLVTGDTVGGGALASAGFLVARSPLLFQGGNLLVTTDPRDRARILLVGEAEVRRNVSLGLTVDQARDALRLEFGADRLVELPTPSFHLDLDVSVRIVDGRLVAFVNDADAATALVIEAGVAALARSGRLPPSAEDAARAAIAAGDDAALLGILGPALAPTRGPALTVELAAAFTTTTIDRGIANLQRVLAALDRFRAVHAPQRSMPSDPALRGYFEAIRRGRSAERDLRARLDAAGFEVVRVPGLADGDRGASPVNMLQLPDRVLISGTGGLLGGIDLHQCDAVSRVVGPAVAVQAIGTDETQRRSGGLHCAIQAGWDTPRNR